MNKLIFVVLVSIFKWSYVLHVRCLLVKLYITILSVGPNETQHVPGAHQPLVRTTSIAITQSSLAHCPHLQGQPLTPTRCSWDALGSSLLEMWSLHLFPPHEHRSCPTTGTFWEDGVLVPGLSPGSQICKTHHCWEMYIPPPAPHPPSQPFQVWTMLVPQQKCQRSTHASSLSHFVSWALKQPDFTPQATGERRANKSWSKKERNHKDKSSNKWNRDQKYAFIAKINRTKNWFFEKINNIDNPLARLMKEKKEVDSNKELKNFSKAVPVLILVNP